MYFYQNRDRFNDWQVVFIYPSRSVEQRDLHPFRGLLALDQVHRVYLDELGDMQELPLRVALAVLTTVSTREAPAAARELLTRAEREAPRKVNRAII